VHVLIAALYSHDSTQGLFIPETDEFVIGMNTPETFLNFKAIHISSSGIQRINGIAMFVAAQIAPPEEFPIFISVYLINIDQNYMFSAIWVPEETTLTLGEEFTVPPAKIFSRNVELINSP